MSNETSWPDIFVLPLDSFLLIDNAESFCPPTFWGGGEKLPINPVRPDDKLINLRIWILRASGQLEMDLWSYGEQNTLLDTNYF